MRRLGVVRCALVLAWLCATGAHAGANHRPSPPTGLNQYDRHAAVAIPVGDEALGIVVFRGTGKDADARDKVRLEVEVKPVGLNFTGEVTCASDWVKSGLHASCEREFTGGVLYHWRARIRDSRGATGPWVSFGDNAETEPDFFGFLRAAPSAGVPGKPPRAGQSQPGANRERLPGSE
jgi:hypothetical protein